MSIGKSVESIGVVLKLTQVQLGHKPGSKPISRQSSRCDDCDVQPVGSGPEAVNGLEVILLEKDLNEFINN